MTIRSEHTAHIRFATADAAAADPLDTGLVRVMRNNLLHRLDSSGRVLVSWAGATGGESCYLDPATASATIDSHVWTSTPVYVQLQEDGSTWPIRCHALGQEWDPGVGVSIFRIALTTGDSPDQWLSDARADDAASASSPTTPNCVRYVGGLSWSSTVLTLPPNRVDSTVLRQARAVDAIGGSTVTVPVAMVRITIWGTGTEMAMHTFTAVEYCGGT